MEGEKENNELVISKVKKANDCVNELYEAIYSQSRDYIGGLSLAIENNFLVETDLARIVVDFRHSNYWEFYQKLVEIMGKSFNQNYCIELWNEYNLGDMNMNQALKHFIFKSLDHSNVDKFKIK